MLAKEHARLKDVTNGGDEGSCCRQGLVERKSVELRRSCWW
jgi:hypothetical protein